jgi:hypothetical protein
MTLKQEGNKVTGHSEYNGDRTDITGTVEKNKLTFTYAEGEAKGEGWFELAADGNSLTGKWRADGSTEWSDWTGKRAGAAVAKVETFTGIWETNWGRMRLRQTDNKVEGIYGSASDSQLVGTIEGGKLKYTWKEGQTSGEGWFELQAGGQKINGQWRSKGEEKWQEWTGKRVTPAAGRSWLVVLEANWETDLAQAEYAWGAMLKAFFARSPQVQVRHRYFTDVGGLRKWCRELAYLPEPVVLVIASHGSPKGAEVDGKTIGVQAMAECLRWANDLKLVHFASCSMMKGTYPQELMKQLGPRATFPLSGYTTDVDWGASAVIEFMYYELILNHRMSPKAATEQLLKNIPLSGEKPVPGSVFQSAGLRVLEPAKR